VKADAIKYVFDDLPAEGSAREVAPGVHWVRMPLPFKLDHINLWVLADGDGWTVVDTGFGYNGTEDIWERVFAGDLAGRPVKRLIVTHFHPDHMGLAGWFARRFGVEMSATLGEYAFGRMLSLDRADSEEAKEVNRGFYRAAGFGPELMAKVEARGNPYPRRAQMPPGSFRRLKDGDIVEIGGNRWRVIVGLGHSPEHACLHCEALGVLISGDQILPRITPNVSVWPQEPENDPLALFVASLERFRGLSSETLVLPSHDAPFTGLEARLDQLAHHHDSRLEQTLEACAQPADGVTILGKLFRRELDDHQLFFAIGETLAHLHYLMGQGRMERHVGADGVHRFQRV
jgi:glyoxylase-like metal-dependent hydrolase (beta-lactamase superfamily II)